MDEDETPLRHPTLLPDDEMYLRFFLEVVGAISHTIVHETKCKGRVLFAVFRVGSFSAENALRLAAYAAPAYPKNGE